MKYFSITKLLIAAITLVLIVLIFVPYATVFNPADNLREDQRWQPSFIWNDFILLIIYISFALLWTVYLFLKEQKISQALKVTLLILSICWSGLSLGSLVLPIQDFTPNLGASISLLLFPVFTIYFVHTQILYRSKSK